MKSPNFLIIGAPKCGTTSISALLSNHKEIYFSEPKETRFFTEDYGKGVEYYERKYFKNATEPRVGEGDISNFIYPIAPKRIYETLGKDTKIIISLRDPVDRCWSAYLMGMRDARFNSILSSVIETNLKQLEHFQKSNIFYRDLRWKSEILQNGHYYIAIKRYLRFFPEENIHIIIFERLIKQQEQQIKRIYDFLNISKESDLSLPNSNPYQSKFIRNIISALPFTSFIPQNVKYSINSLLKNKKPMMSNTDKNNLIEYYKPMVRNLKDYLDDPLNE